MQIIEKAELIKNGRTALGIEFGSTRIKAVLLDENNQSLASGSYSWENQYVDGIWTYAKKDIINGLQTCYRDLINDVKTNYSVEITSIGAIGISGMMHGYIALDQDDNLLVPFRTWRNTITLDASKILSEKFNFAIPQRWTVAHLYQALLNQETHVKEIAYLTTLAGYIHYLLTGRKVVGIGEASGIFPIDSTINDYDTLMVETFNKLLKEKVEWNFQNVFPEVLVAGDVAGELTKSGASLLDPSGNLQPGIVVCPPEGDAGTGMVATNAIKKRTGNISAGTSVFAMIVLEKSLSKPYDNIDMVTTPDGSPVAMVHVNNCSSDLNAWVGFANDILISFGVKVEAEQLYSILFNKALEGDQDTGKLLSYNFFSGEHTIGTSEGRPMLVRNPEGAFTLANVMKANLYSSFAVMKIGMDTLDQENVQIDSITAHGGLFKTPIVAQRFLASVLGTPVTVMTTAGEGGAYGMAVLANYLLHKNAYINLDTYLEKHVFSNVDISIESPDKNLVDDFTRYIERYLEGLAIERQAIASIK